MTNNQLSSLSAGAISVIVAVALFWWLANDPSAEFAVFKPGADNEPPPSALNAGKAVVIGEHWEQYDSSQISGSSSWPRFRGTDYSNISHQPITLSTELESNPNILWSVDLGEGHAGPAVHNGRIYILDYDEENKADALRCFALSDGREIWKRSYNVKIKRNHGISRTIPAVTDDFILTMGPRCHVMCLSTETGEMLWGMDLQRDFGVTVPLWYTGQCPLIDGKTAVIATGGSNLMMGVDCATGEILWETPNPNSWKMSHSSILPMTLQGKRQYVYTAIDGIVSVSAEPEDLGKILWETNLWTHSVTAPSPLVLSDERIFVTSGYSAGGMLLEITNNNGVFTVDSLKSVRPHNGMASEQQTPIYRDGLIYGILPKDGGAANGQFACFAADDIGKMIWSSGKTNRFGLGPYILADDKFFILDDEGVLTVIEASTSNYKQLARVKILPGPDTWAPLAIVDGKLIARDSHRMICLDLMEKGINS